MGWYDIYAKDAISAYRVLGKRIVKHPIMMAWFIVLMIGFAWIVLRMFQFAMTQEESVLTDVEPNTFLLIVFFVFLAKAVADTTRRVVQNKELIFFLSQPIRQRGVLLGKFLSEQIFNVLILETIVGVMILVMLTFGVSMYLDPVYLVYTFLMVILGTSLGFTFSIVNALRPLRRRGVLFLAEIPFFVVVYNIISNFYGPLSGWPLALILFLLCVSSFLLLFICDRVFLDAWTFGISANEGAKRSVYDFFERSPLVPQRLMDERLRALVRRELAEKMRSGAIWGTVITTIAITGGTMYAISSYTDVDVFQSAGGKYVYPLIVGMGIFAISTLEPGISSLSSIGREGKNLWILKTAPFRGRVIAQAKALSNVAISPLIVFGTAMLSAYYLSYHSGLTLVHYSFFEIAIFSALGAQTMIFLFTGLGIWFGAKYPNFDESNKGNPDIMTMYIFSMSCLFLGMLFVSVPFVLMIQRYNVLGLLMMILAMGIAALFLYYVTERGGLAIEKLEYG